MSKTYYDIFGISQNATQKEIKQAYRKLIREYHPDANPSLDALEMTKRINNIYEVLSNPSKRQAYDYTLNHSFEQTHASNESKHYEQDTTPTQPEETHFGFEQSAFGILGDMIAWVWTYILWPVLKIILFILFAMATASANNNEEDDSWIGGEQNNSWDDDD